MGKRGPKPKGKVKIEWSPEFAYGIGLLVTDGNLSPDGRHINFTSKDLELIQLFQKALRIDGHIGRKANGPNREKPYFVSQFGDVLFYDFLLTIGLTPNKSKTISTIGVPSEYFFDFLRGCFDGDGCTYSYFDPRWKSSFMYYTCFVSASEKHILWLQEEIFDRLGIHGHITKAKRKGSVYCLKYAKRESLVLLARMYSAKDTICLSRKRLKIEAMLSIVDMSLSELRKDLTK